MNNFKIRKLERTDAQEFQRLRLFALQNNSTSFGSSFEEEVKKSLEQFEVFIDPTNERVFFGEHLKTISSLEWLDLDEKMASKLNIKDLYEVCS